ncbi:MAG: amino acid adenylation domain-containing protein, partial [bacterium]|nr:amino acid adenylation domain-containing protein [bacterium]
MGGSRPWQLLLLSAHSDSQLDAATWALTEHLRQHSHLDLADVACTLQVERRAFSCRRMVTCTDVEDAVGCLETLDPTRVFTASEVADSANQAVYFMFSGLGAQYLNMGRELYETEPAYRTQVDRCSQLLLPRLGCDLRQVLYPAAGEERKAGRLLGDTGFAQPALFVVEYALARLWIDWGVRPQAMIGHSFGEYVAACLAGVFSLEACLALVTERGRLLRTTAVGAVLSVSLPEQEAVSLIGEELSLAAINAPSLCAVSGPAAAVETVHEQFVERGVECRRLHVGFAAHSRLVDPIVAPFVEEVAKFRLRPPQIPYVSNVTGRWIRDDEATDPGYWGRHLRQPVRFMAGLNELLEDPGAAFLEIGPGRTLVTLANRHSATAGRLVIASMRHPEEEVSDVGFLLNALGRLWLGGVTVDWEGFHAGRQTRCAPLPEGVEGVAAAEILHRRAVVSAAPRNPIEELLAGIWIRVLGRDVPVGIHDNFFDLGGDSLLATRVLSRVGRELRVKPPLRALFERPTVAGLAETVTAALGRDQELEAPPLRPAERRGTLPLSFAQQRLWFLDRLEPGSALYNVPVALRLDGRLDRGALGRALNEIVRRHEVLRTTYEEVDGVPVQVIQSPGTELPLPVLELGGLPEPRRRTEADRLAWDRGRQPFDPQRDLPLRVTLLRLDEAKHVLLLTMHHIACDRWTIAVLLRELTVLYQAFAAGKASPLPELGVQYADFAVWQRQWLTGKVLEAQLAYWREQLAELPVLELPTDRPRPAVQSLRGALERFVLPPRLDRRLRELGRKHGVTLFMTSLAAFHTLLRRHTGQEDVALGSAIAGRNRAEIESLAGFFVNTLILRGDLRGDPTVGELLARSRDVALGAHAHQDLPFEALVEELVPERSLSRNPLVQVLLVLQNAPAGIRELDPGLATELEYLDTGIAKFDLDLVLEDDEGALAGKLAYNADLFDRTTIRRLVRHFRTLLEGLAADPNGRLSQLPLMSAAERHQLLREWNPTPSDDLDAGPRVHELFETQAARIPEAVAVVCADGECLSYGELNRRANRLAHALRARGVERDVPVGLSMEPSPELVVGLLAILKSGGALVPLDPSYPEERLAFMLEDTGISVLLTAADKGPTDLVERVARANDAAGDAYHRSLIPVSQHRSVSPFALVCPSRQQGRRAPAAAGSDADPPRAADPGSLAYVIYTSGSTGRPKGVAIPHGAIAAHCRTMCRQLGLQSGDRVLQSASFNFDVALEQTLPALLRGCRLILRGRDLWLPSELSEKFRELGITVADLPAGYWQRWVEESLAAAESAPLRPLRLVSVGGDVMVPEAACGWGRTPQATVDLLNAYGPTEATITATTFQVPAAGPERCCRHRVPIGRPLAGRSLRILDRRGVPVAIGVPGELCLGGTLLARGYLKRPALTAERFVPDPWVAPPSPGGARLYRTGDLARHRPGGNVDFLGRIDDQVKVRGFRLELGEIEAALAAHPAIRETVVVARESGRAPGDRELVAYLVGEREVAVRELRAFLRDRLPSYMLPAAFVFPETLPRLPNGKVDRAALKRQALPEALVSAEELVPPRDATEELLAGIWEEVLSSSGRIGVHDNFFELGGHSLLGTQVLSRVRRTLGIEPPLRILFERPTVAGLAGYVASALRREQGLEAPPLRPVACRTAPKVLPLSFAQQRLWFLDQFEPGSTLYNVPIPLRLTGRLDPRALIRALNDVVSRHEVLRTRFEPAADPADGPVQVIRPVAELPLPVVDLTGLREPQRRDQTRRLMGREARRPFDLARGPLLRAVLLRRGGEAHTLFLAVHHIAFDGWSTGVLLRELATRYQASAAGADSSDPRFRLPELRIQYADFAVWQRQWLEGEVLEGRLAYWQEQLAELPVLELPTDRPRPAVKNLRGATVSFLVPEAIHRRLQELSRRQGSTLFMTLLAAFHTLLGRTTGQQDLAVGSAIANRNRAELEALLGFFVNTLVLRGDLRGDPTFRRLLARVRDVALGAYVHQDLPFEALVERLDPDRHLSQNPLVQVFLVLQNAPLETRELAPGLTVELEPFDVDSAKFDLTLGLEEGEAGLRGTLVYDVDLFDAATMRRMAGHFRRVVEGAVADPDRCLSELPLLSAAELQQLLREWNDTLSPYPSQAPIHQLFEAQAAGTPEAVAVVFGGRPEEQLSYRELNRRANRLAHTLRAQGVDSEQCVGLCVERSVEMVVGTLGILKAGGAYLPLDPSYPPERLAFMLEDAASPDGRPPVLVTQERLAERLPATLPELRTICLDRDRAALSRSGTDNPSPVATAENLAYVMYTSGSTGRPKGVRVVHRGVVRLVRETSYAVLDDREVTLQFAPISFDASTLEIWGPLLNGGRLVVFAAHTPSLEELGATLARHRVTTLWLTAGLFHQMVEENPAGLAGVRQMLAGGDVLSARHVRRVSEKFQKCTVINGYGPTESTTFTCCSPMREPAEVGDPVSIGRPIANTRVHVLDRRLCPVPVGVPGELTIGGDGLARDYLRRPGLTAERFIPNPLGEVSQRLYRTGDLVRLLPDGRIDFLGRTDHQVKLRGFRIELGEVETVLGRHPGVRQAVAMVREDRPGDRRLAAYAVRREGLAELDAGELRAWLGRSLPDYMVPSALVLLDALPLTANGKVDRAALPEPASGAGAPGGDRVAPRNPIEEIMAAIWEQVLGATVAGPVVAGPVGIHDDFFELGGHSLLATQVVSRVRRELHVELPLRLLFEQPTVAGLAAGVAEALRRQQDLEIPPILPGAREGHPALSFAQQRLWFIDRLEPGSARYNLPFSLHLRGRLAPGALARALGEIVGRHEVLRTRFETVAGGPDDGPVQMIHAVLDQALPVCDLAGLDPAERRAEADRLARAEARRPFDLARGPMLRTALLRLGDQEHLLLLTAHHIAFDAWSVGVFLRELRTLYQAFTAGAGMAASALPELPVQYADFALWQRRWLTGEVLEKQLAYWRKQLAGLPVLELPTDRPRPAVQSFRGAGEEFRVPAEPAGRLGELSRRQGATLFMTLLAAFQLLLSRSSAQQDLAVGSPIANRNQGETEGLVGFFVNTLVLRADLSGGPTYRQLLARLRDVALGAYAHQDLPFEKLVEELEPERDLSHNPLVQVLFTLQNAPMAIPELAPGLRAKLDDVAVETAKFDLTVGLEEDEDGLRGMWVYNTDLFDRATIRRLAGHFGVLLRGIARDPDERLSELPLLAPAERHELLYEWNDTASDYPAEISIARLFELQVKRTPEAVALVFDGELLSYRELNRRANRLAHHLLALGVDRGGGAPEVMTGIYMDRSPRTLVAILAILKAGGVYLPLDLSYPPERLAFMLKDAGAPVLISEQEQAAMLPPDLAKHGVKLVCLDRDEAAIARASDRNPEASAAVTGDHLAYVIYTSGSTGIPKGVAVSHRAVARLVFHTNYIDLGADDRVAQASTTSFDAATFELWGALVHGGRLVGISKEVALAPQAFAAALREHRITALFLTTALFNQMVSEDPAVFNPLRHLLFGGEAVDPHWVREALASGGPQRLLHVYGPTESTTYATWQRVREVARGARTVPIGGPLANTEIYVLDRSLEPVPAGVAGELLIAGDGLARGYLKRPGLTAERFIPNPLGGNPSASGSRLYRTGDLVRYLPEGAIEFLGRLDFQVKIRGFRIELGEVEAVLGRHPAVREAFVIADRTESGDQYLVAYVVPEGEAVAAGELREFLLRTLPEYMVPSVVVSLEALPLGPTGKVDRAALPAPARAIEPVAHFVAPRGPVEEALARIWAEVLGERPTCPPPGEPQTRPQVGAHDNFFALGGHSLLATRVVSRIRTTLGVELPLMKLFEAPTVAGLAARVEELMRAAGARPAPPIERVPRAGDLQLSFAQERLWFLDRYEPDSPVYNIPVAYELTGRLSPAALAASLGAVVERHEALRTTFGEGPRQSIATELEINLPLVDLRGLPAGVRPAVAAELAEAEARRPFDLAAGPLLRVALLRLEEDRHRLLVTLHHIISDGWSIEVLEGELAAFYQFFSTAERGAPSIPELPIQYPDFAVWQRHRLTGTVFEEQLAYWRERLAGASTALELPFDRPRPPVLTHRGTEVSRQLPAALSEPLEDLGRRQGTTLFMTLLAAFFTLLHRYTGQRDLLVGTPVANRGRREIEGLIGFFVNTLVLRCDLGAEPTVRELLARVREAALGAYAHQDLPFERLVEELRPERDLSRSPLFQAMFGVQRARRWELAPGLPMRRVSVENRSVKFDISLYFVEAEHGLRAGVGYNTDLFDRVTIERLLAHLERLLGAIVEDPERSVSELPLLTPGQEHALLVEWNDTAIDDAVGGCVHELFAQQAARRPAAVAVTHGERTLTYGELSRRADRLARQLRRRGVGPDEVVGLFVERSPEMLVGMLGILAAGGAYLPLDPDYPASRLSYMLADAGTWVILTQEGLRDRLGD